MSDIHPRRHGARGQDPGYWPKVDEDLLSRASWRPCARQHPSIILSFLICVWTDDEFGVLTSWKRMRSKGEKE
jgi:hypothetical protein